MTEIQVTSGTAEVEEIHMSGAGEVQGAGPSAAKDSDIHDIYAHSMV